MRMFMAQNKPIISSEKSLTLHKITAIPNGGSVDFSYGQIAAPMDNGGVVPMWLYMHPLGDLYGTSENEPTSGWALKAQNAQHPSQLNFDCFRRGGTVGGFSAFPLIAASIGGRDNTFVYGAYAAMQTAWQSTSLNNISGGQSSALANLGASSNEAWVMGGTSNSDNVKCAYKFSDGSLFTAISELTGDVPANPIPMASFSLPDSAVSLIAGPNNYANPTLMNMDRNSGNCTVVVAQDVNDPYPTRVELDGLENIVMLTLTGKLFFASSGGKFSQATLPGNTPINAFSMDTSAYGSPDGYIVVTTKLLNPAFIYIKRKTETSFTQQPITFDIPMTASSPLVDVKVFNNYAVFMTAQGELYWAKFN